MFTFTEDQLAMQELVRDYAQNKIAPLADEIDKTGRFPKEIIDGLQEIVAQLIGGALVPVNSTTFQNDFDRFGTKDDVLTLLIHLGYLTYNVHDGTARIPNEEVRTEFRNFLANDSHGKHWSRLMGRSRTLLANTIAGNGDAVALALNEIQRGYPEGASLWYSKRGA